MNAPYNLSLNQQRVYQYRFPSPIYACNWSFRNDKILKLAVGSFIDDYNNKIRITHLCSQTNEITELICFDHPYPATKIHWIPDVNGNFPDLIGASGDYLRIWKIVGPEAQLQCLLNSNRHPTLCAPLTSFDWNRLDPSLVVTASIDTTCTIWSIETQQAISHVPLGYQVYKQLIAHEKEVYDVAFSTQGSGRDIFGTSGADGSIRIFDLRNLAHSNIVHEHKNRFPLLRIYWNRFDSNYIATFSVASNEAILIDTRMTRRPIAELTNHQSCINGLAWAPRSNNYLCSVGSDKRAFIWDTQKVMCKTNTDPILCYTASDEINQIQWNEINSDWISICFNNCVQILRV
ncbi:hypothetical protein A3Q56_03962 [Intoshia linei]|uniref:Uncharacterized protein n=1 Tax=Intoshia linei TaxID=1819745 RepID=A0A177B1Z8_9BILA|nr:hypothetical protein A3Q56_03962 [Intoshia linei]